MESFMNVALAIGFVFCGLALAVLAGILLYRSKPAEKKEAPLRLNAEAEST